MHWIAPNERDITNGTLDKRLRQAADQLRAKSGLTSAQYFQPVLGLIFLRFAASHCGLVAGPQVDPGRLRATR